MRRLFAGALMAGLCATPLRAQDTAAIDRAFDAYWRAGSTKAAEKAAAGILATGAAFATVHERLAEGRPYEADV